VLRARLLTAAVVLPILAVFVCCAPLWLFAAMMLVFTGLGLQEYFALARPFLTLPPAVGILWGVAVAVAMLAAEPALVVGVLLGGFFIMFAVSLRDSQPDQSVIGLGLSLLGVVYVGFLLPHLIWVRQGPDGRAWVFFIFFVVMIGDAVAYAAGRIWGRHKLIPHISPGKTIEGSMGAVIGNLCTGIGSWMWLFPERSLIEVTCLALGIGCLAQIGDLCESALKRAFGAKDSGQLFPGHGGVLDRVDSLLFPAAFIYYYVTLWR